MFVVNASNIEKDLLWLQNHANHFHDVLTETESMETLDQFIKAMIDIASEVREYPEIVQEAPNDTIV